VTRLDPDRFWEFSLAFYHRAPVAAACLSLQDRRGADVNILLLCCWLATLEMKIGHPGLRAADDAVARWRLAVLEPLRAVRRRVDEDWDAPSAAARKAIKTGILGIELDCERLAQGLILGAATGGVADEAGALPRGLASAALEAYLDMLIGGPEEQDAADLAALLEAL
jgi:uncharacterized protein (TIGR02444 family)